MITYRNFADDMRRQTNQAIRDSEERHQENHLDEPFIYFPSADYTERFRQQIPEIILMSAFLDFITSPLITDENIAYLTQKPILLDPLSLWRSSLAMTTIGPGHTRLVLNIKNENHKESEIDFDVNFGWTSSDSEETNPTTYARDKRERLLIENLVAEQERFRLTLLKHLDSVKRQIKLRSRHSLQENTESLEDINSLEEPSFEALMIGLSED